MQKILYKIFSVPQNIVMDMNNVIHTITPSRVYNT